MGTSGRRAVGAGFSLIEVLVVLAVIGLLLSILLPAASGARHETKAVACASNLRTIGHLIHVYLADHSDCVAPVIANEDRYWTQDPRIGWDIETGTWADVPGGVRTIWQCPTFSLPFVGNARALGLHYLTGRCYLVGLRHWYEPARLVLAYDLQPNLTENAYAHALDPAAGDLSDESYVAWPLGPRPTVYFRLSRYGPHRERFSVLFADAHARTSTTWRRGSEAVYWTGPPWWK